ncbi:hypothetical protein GSS87_01900 [Corynebacterium sp. 4HC-13]|uniref:zinc ribbon domain-containing protein n=1 Tax=Corynebacterium anserum TaxID=2684406 RepID=UPI0016398699|nr:C4-type zinc ribbon domain-containing protein [Corynebacterium anserum]MBC2681172.1 hypothetical protein [Corynebacterium anserum]
MRYTDQDRHALVALTDALHELSVLEARLQTLPEREKVEKLKQRLSKDGDNTARQQARAQEQRTDVMRLRREVDNLRERERSHRKQLRLETDTQRRKELRCELSALLRRLEDFEERLQRAERTATIFDDPLPGVDKSEHQTQIIEAEEALERAECALQAEIDAAKARAEQARAVLTPSVLEVFERGVDEHGVGAARLKRGMCQGCRMGLDPQALRDLRQAPKDELQHCPECNVILLFDDGDLTA